MALVLENGVWKLQADGGGSASTVIWSVDFSTVSDHDFMSTSTLSLEGVTFTAENANGTRATQFEVDSGVLKIEPKQGSGYYGGTYTGPQLSAQWADLMAYAASGAFDAEKRYIWRWIFTSSLAQGQGGGPLGGIRTVRATDEKDLNFTMVTSGDWRFVKGGTIYKDHPVEDSGVASGIRSMAVGYGHSNFSAMASTSTEEGVAFGGIPIYAGAMWHGNPYEDFRAIAANPPVLDLTAGTAQAYIGAYWYNGSGTYIYSFDRLELHEVG